MNTENSKTNDYIKFIYQFTDKLNLENPNKNMTLANLSIYYPWKNIKSAYSNNKFNISAPTWNDKFDLLDDSYSLSYKTYKTYKIIWHISSKNMKL